MSFKARRRSSDQRKKRRALRKYAARVFGLRMVSVKKVKNRSDASGPSAAMTAGSVKVVEMDPATAGTVGVSAFSVSVFNFSIVGRSPALALDFTRIKG